MVRESAPEVRQCSCKLPEHLIHTKLTVTIRQMSNSVTRIENCEFKPLPGWFYQTTSPDCQQIALDDHADVTDAAVSFLNATGSSDAGYVACFAMGYCRFVADGLLEYVFWPAM